MSENVRHISVFHGICAVFLANSVAHLEIFHQRFSAYEIFIRHHIPWPDQDSSVLNQLLQTIFHLRPDFQIVVQYNRLPVQVKYLILLILLQSLNQIVHHAHQAVTVVLKALVPFSVPMCMGNHVKFHFFHTFYLCLTLLFCRHHGNRIYANPRICLFVHHQNHTVSARFKLQCGLCCAGVFHPHASCRGQGHKISPDSVGL